ncbi:MAG: hypothetical protein JXK07_16535 [Spirochaetes bacterium]|nr:hypothetical protein [Spirochaetota bacterium]MBN2771193.1 hypothetical protein [Spirochaetota bacterium]
MNLKEKILIRKHLVDKDYNAVLALTETISKKEKNGYVFYLMAKSQYLLGYYNESLNSIKRALIYKDTDFDIFLLAGRIYFKLNYYKKAEEFYKYVLKIRPDNVEAYASYAFLLYIIGNDNKTEQYINKAFNINNDNLFILLTHFKIILYNNGFKKEAYVLEDVLTHSSSDVYYLVHSALKMAYNNNKRASRQLLIKSGLKKYDPRLYKALSKAISYKKNKKKSTLNKKAGLIKIMITIMISSVLFAFNKDLFLYWIFLCLIMLISRTVSLLSRLFSNEKGLNK